MNRFLTVLAFIAAAALSACAAESDLAPFASDGCSLFPDRSFITQADWCSCCFEHDIAYWKGGTEDERRQADIALRECVAERTGSEEFAQSMFLGVRAGGSPRYFTWYRWGYGWAYGRGYEPLSEAEQQQAEQLLADYESSGQEGVCETEGDEPLWSPP